MNTLQFIPFFTVIMALASLGVALISISVAFGYKKAYGKKSEESKNALKNYASVQHNLALQTGLIQDLRDQIEVYKKEKTELEAKHDDLLNLHEQQLRHNSNQFSTIKKLESDKATIEKDLIVKTSEAIALQQKIDLYRKRLELREKDYKSDLNAYEVNRQNQEIFREQIKELKK